MRQEDKKVSEGKNYVKPQLVDYGDLSALTTQNNTSGAFDNTNNMDNQRTGPGPNNDVIDQSFEQFDRSSSSDSSRRGGRSGG
jgi:hypothetical protein